ncbi:MAG: zinc ribbon domain-containing protein, partial [bacterium]
NQQQQCGCAPRFIRRHVIQTNEELMMQHDKWQCPKCKNHEFETGQFAATGGGFEKIFDVQNL